MYTLNTLSIIKHFSKLYNSFTLYFEIHRIFIYIIIFHIFINWQEKFTGKIFLSFEKTGKIFPQDFFPVLMNWQKNFSCQYLQWEKISRVLLEIKVRKKIPQEKNFPVGFLTGKWRENFSHRNSRGKIFFNYLW